MPDTTDSTSRVENLDKQNSSDLTQQQSLNRSVQDSLQQGSDPSIWNKTPGDATASNVDMTGTSNLYHDSTVPTDIAQMLNGSGSNSQNKDFQAVGDVLQDMSKVMKDVSGMIGTGQNAADDGKLAQSALAFADSGLKLASDYLQDFLNSHGGTPGDGGTTPITTKPGDGGTTPVSTTPGDGGTTPITTKPGDGGTTPVSTTPGDGGTTPVSTTPGDGGTTPVSTTPGDGGTTPVSTTPGDGGTTPVSTTPGDGGTTPVSTTPGDGGTTPVSTTPGDGGTTPVSTTPGDGGTTPVSTTPGDGTTPITPIVPQGGNYSVVNGTLMGPDGKPFDAKGVAVYASQAPAEAATILQSQPNINFIRLAADPSQDTPDQIQTDIQAFQKINPNVVVEVEDHHSGGTDGTTDNTYAGQALTDEENWYSQIAANNKDNPNVMFGTANEPNNPFNEQTVVDQQVGIYNAIRGAGNNSTVLLEAQGGGSFGPQQADAAAYSKMQNVAWDVHYYGWETKGDTSVANNVSALQNEMAGGNGITESNGAGGQQNIPFIVGEYGDSTDGQTVDGNGAAAVDAVQTANNQGLVQGAIAWTFNGNNEPNNSDAITQDGTLNTLTPYGQEILAYNNTGATGGVT